MRIINKKNSLYFLIIKAVIFEVYLLNISLRALAGRNLTF